MKKLGGKRAKRKGYRLEYELARRLRNKYGVDAERIPLSGAVRGFKGDLRVSFSLELKGIAEVKGRKNGFRELYKFLEGKDLLFVKADRKEWLLVIPERSWRFFETGGER